MPKSVLVGALALGVTGGILFTSARASAYYMMRNNKSHLCAAVAGGNQNPGASIVQQTCDGSMGQLWNDGAGLYGPHYIVNFVHLDALNRADRYLGVPNARMVNGVTLIDWTIDASPNQQWDWHFVFWDGNGHPCYWIRNQDVSGGGEKVIGVLGGRTDVGAPVVIWDLFRKTAPPPDPDWDSHPDQFWCTYVPGT